MVGAAMAYSMPMIQARNSYDPWLMQPPGTAMANRRGAAAQEETHG